jgi:hypothetical protein
VVSWLGAWSPAAVGTSRSRLQGIVRRALPASCVQLWRHQALDGEESLREGRDYRQSDGKEEVGQSAYH